MVFDHVAMSSTTCSDIGHGVATILQHTKLDCGRTRSDFFHFDVCNETNETGRVKDFAS